MIRASRYSLLHRRRSKLLRCVTNTTRIETWSQNGRNWFEPPLPLNPQRRPMPNVSHQGRGGGPGGGSGGGSGGPGGPGGFGTVFCVIPEM